MFHVGGKSQAPGTAPASKNWPLDLGITNTKFDAVAEHNVLLVTVAIVHRHFEPGLCILSKGRCKFKIVNEAING
jgi:hypothetical protein